MVFQVHYKQVEDRNQLHLGIDRDLERQNKKKSANLHALVQQDELAKAYQRAEDREKIRDK
jgi:hypothetical protein